MGTLQGKIEHERTIMELKVGEDGWTSPDSLELHINFDAYLYLEELVYEKPNEKNGITLYVKRYGEGKDDFLANVDKVKNYSWDKIYIDKEKYEDELTNPQIAILEYKSNPEKKQTRKSRTLEEKLREAEESENYEEAAKIRDKIIRAQNYKNNSIQ